MPNHIVLKGAVYSCLAIFSGLGAAAAKAQDNSASNITHCVNCFKGMPVDLEAIPGSDPLEKKLKRDLFYTDSTGTVWKAGVGDETDGASIPGIFVPIVGDRFEPDFLPAAVIHDHYTTDAHKVRSWTDTARVFYQAMITNQTPVAKAKVMYYAVYVFGPHWGKLKPGQYCGENCINVAPHKYAIQSDGTDTIERSVDTPSDGEKFYSEPQHAVASDVVEIQEIKSMIEAAEVLGSPMTLSELERHATLRHPSNPFIAIAAQRQ